jgi:hypothetical protein
MCEEHYGQGGEMTQALYAHMNNKILKNLPTSSFIHPSIHPSIPSQVFLLYLVAKLYPHVLLSYVSHSSPLILPPPLHSLFFQRFQRKVSF